MRVVRILHAVPYFTCGYTVNAIFRAGYWREHGCSVGQNHTTGIVSPVPPPSNPIFREMHNSLIPNTRRTNARPRPRGAWASSRDRAVSAALLSYLPCKIWRGIGLKKAAQERHESDLMERAKEIKPRKVCRMGVLRMSTYCINWIRQEFVTNTVKAFDPWCLTTTYSTYVTPLSLGAEC